MWQFRELGPSYEFPDATIYLYELWTRGVESDMSDKDCVPVDELRELVSKWNNTKNPYAQGNPFEWCAEDLVDMIEEYD